MLGAFLNTIYEFIKIPFIARFVSTLLLPNALVLGFSVAGLNSNQHYLWAHVVGPYWQAEKVVFYLLLAVSLMMAIFDLVMFIRERANHHDEDFAYQCQQESALVPSPLKSKPQENVIPFPQEHHKTDARFNSERQSHTNPLPQEPKLSAEEIKQKALRDIIGGGR